MKKVLILMSFMLIFGATCSAGTVGFTLGNGSYNNPPEPRLRYPIYDSVTISGDQPLEFQWWNDWTDTRGFILKIYKGYNMYADNLLLKEELPVGATSTKVQANLFEEGKVYTWSLVRIAISGYKSEASFNSFKVVKK
jgi:hypothetical protein